MRKRADGTAQRWPYSALALPPLINKNVDVYRDLVSGGGLHEPAYRLCRAGDDNI